MCPVPGVSRIGCPSIVSGQVQVRRGDFVALEAGWIDSDSREQARWVGLSSSRGGCSARVPRPASWYKRYGEWLSDGKRWFCTEPEAPTSGQRKAKTAPDRSAALPTCGCALYRVVFRRYVQTKSRLHTGTGLLQILFQAPRGGLEPPTLRLTAAPKDGSGCFLCAFGHPQPSLNQRWLRLALGRLRLTPGGCAQHRYRRVTSIRSLDVLICHRARICFQHPHRRPAGDAHHNATRRAVAS